MVKSMATQKSPPISPWRWLITVILTLTFISGLIALNRSAQSDQAEQISVNAPTLPIVESTQIPEVEPFFEFYNILKKNSLGELPEDNEKIATTVAPTTMQSGNAKHHNANPDSAAQVIPAKQLPTQSPASTNDPITSNHSAEADGQNNEFDEPSKPILPTMAANDDDPSESALARPLILQIAAFQQPQSAQKLVEKLAHTNLSIYVQAVRLFDNQQWYRVVIGPFTSQNRLLRVEQQLRALNFQPLRRVKEP